MTVQSETDGKQSYRFNRPEGSQRKNSVKELKISPSLKVESKGPPAATASVSKDFINFKQYLNRGHVPKEVLSGAVVHKNETSVTNEKK